MLYESSTLPRFPVEISLAARLSLRPSRYPSFGSASRLKVPRKKTLQATKGQRPAVNLRGRGASPRFDAIQYEPCVGSCLLTSATMGKHKTLGAFTFSFFFTNLFLWFIFFPFEPLLLRGFVGLAPAETRRVQYSGDDAVGILLFFLSRRFLSPFVSRILLDCALVASVFGSLVDGGSKKETRKEKAIERR